MLYHLRDAGLQLDIDKCEFEMQLTKYLKFIMEADKRIFINLDKIKAIME